MNNLPSVTIIILNWNASEFLSNCLTALQYLDYPNLIVQVVDNNSTDDSLHLLASQFPNIPVICNDQNVGFSAGNNVALRQLETDIAVLLNPDVIVSPTWLRNLVAPMQEDRRIGVAGCKLYYPGGTSLQHAGGYIMGAQAWGNHYGSHEQDNGQYDVLRDVEYVIGGAMAIRKEVLEEVGLFDEEFFLYYEDSDFCFRVREGGYRVVYVPTATAIHIESVTTVKDGTTYIKHFHAGRWRFMLKHFTVNTLLDKSVVAEQVWIMKADVIQLKAAIAAYRAALRQWLSISIMKRDIDGMGINSEQQRTEVKEALLFLRETALINLRVLEPEEPSTFPLMQLEGKPFTSTAPIIGSFIIRFREMWNSVAAKWYIQPLLIQQNQINKQLIDRLHHLDDNFISMDKEQSNMIYKIIELTNQLQSIDNPLISSENHK